MSTCICGHDDCQTPIATTPGTAHIMRIAQAWADLRVAMAKSHPNDDPTTKDSYYDLRDAVRDALAPSDTTEATDAIAHDSIYGADQLSLHELLHAILTARDRLRRNKN